MLGVLRVATTMDNTTVLDTMTAPRSRPLPWVLGSYSSKMPGHATPLTAFWNGGAHANGGSDTSVNIATTDSPFMNTIFPPVLANHRRYYCAQIIFSWQLTTYLAVRTTESVKKATGSANPPNVYTPRVGPLDVHTKREAGDARCPAEARRDRRRDVHRVRLDHQRDRASSQADHCRGGRGQRPIEQRILGCVVLSSRRCGE